VARTVVAGHIIPSSHQMAALDIRGCFNLLSRRPMPFAYRQKKKKGASFFKLYFKSHLFWKLTSVNKFILPTKNFEWSYQNEDPWYLGLAYNTVTKLSKFGGSLLTCKRCGAGSELFVIQWMLQLAACWLRKLR